jgi:hypothetical protein
MPRARKAYERVLRLLPGKLGQLVRTLVSTVRRSAVLTASVILPSRRRANRLDLVLFAWDLEGDALAKAIAASGTDPGRVLVVTNSDAFGPLRRIGCYFEYVPPAGDLERASLGLDRQAFLERRLQDLLSSYSYRRVGVVGATDELRGPLGRVAADVIELEPA